MFFPPQKGKSYYIDTCLPASYNDLTHWLYHHLLTHAHLGYFQSAGITHIFCQ